MSIDQVVAAADKIRGERMDKLQSQNKHLRDALVKYGNHSPQCYLRQMSYRRYCNCGWAVIEKILKGVRNDD